MDITTSAILTSYNHERYLETALDSVLSQDLPFPFEIIAVDDGSTDDSRAILEEWARAHPQIRLDFPPHGGISAAFNRGLELARGRWVAYCGSDDCWHPNHLRNLLEAVERRPGALACFGRARVVDAEGRPDPQSRLFKPPSEPDLLRRLLREGNSLCFTASLIDRHAARAVGGFDPELGVLQDYDLWLKLLQRGSATWTEKPTADFRWHGENASGARASLQVRLDHVRILERALREYPVLARDAALRERVHERLVSAHRRISRRVPGWSERLHHLREARRHGGSWWQLGGELVRPRGRVRHSGPRPAPAPQRAAEAPRRA